MSDWRLWLPPALEKPRVRLYVAGHVVSVLGGWFQQVAMAWLIYRLTGSVFLLGLSGFLANIPYLLFGGLAGMLVDRLPRLPLLIAVDVGLAVLALLLGVLALSGVEAIWVYLAVGTLCGVLNAFEMPVRQSLFKDIVEDRHLLPSAIALSAMVFNTGRMLGPALAGVLLLYLPEGWCFLVNAVSYGAIIVALIAMKLPDSVWHASPAPARGGIAESLAEIATFPGVRYLLPTVVALGLFATSYLHLMPSIVTEFFDGRPSSLGLLMGSAGAGALVAATYLSLLPSVYRQIRLVAVAPMLVGAALLGFAFSRSLAASMALLFLLGANIMLTSNTTNALLQQSAPDQFRGRVIGLYTMAFAGMAPLGNLLAGALASRIGLTATILCNAIAMIAVGFIARWRLHHHPEALRTLLRSIRH